MPRIPPTFASREGKRTKEFAKARLVTAFVDKEFRNPIRVGNLNSLILGIMTTNNIPLAEVADTTVVSATFDQKTVRPVRA